MCENHTGAVAKEEKMNSENEKGSINVAKMLIKSLEHEGVAKEIRERIPCRKGRGSKGNIRRCLRL